MKIILLDRNVISVIKDNLAKTEVDVKRLAKIRDIDNKKNYISPILSVIEGQSGRQESKDELMATLSKESRAISKFFKNASTDTKFFEENSSSFADVFSNNREYKFENYMSYLSDVYQHIYQPISANKRQEFEEKLISASSTHGVPLQHPVFIASLAIVYGSREAQSVIKPRATYCNDEERKKAAYNAVSDLMVISRVGQIRSAIPSNEQRILPVKFFTFDAGLSYILGSIKIDNQRAFDSGGVEISVSLDKRIFPMATDNDWKRIYNLIAN